LGRRGRKRQLAVEDEYWKLILNGVGTVEACRQLGIGHKTGYRWRAERGGLPPLRLGEADHKGRYLSQLERERIATLCGQGLGVREIGRRLGRSPSTVSRELRRNLRPHDGGVYDADLARAPCYPKMSVSGDPAARGVPSIRRAPRADGSYRGSGAWARQARCLPFGEEVVDAGLVGVARWDRVFPRMPTILHTDQPTRRRAIPVLTKPRPIPSVGVT
jgi:transposase